MLNSYYSIVIVKKGTKVSNVSQSICPEHAMELDICTSVGVWSPCLLACSDVNDPSFLFPELWWCDMQLSWCPAPFSV